MTYHTMKCGSTLHLIQQLIIDLSLVDRNHYIAKTPRRENDSEHSLSVAVLCWYFHHKLKTPLDELKIMKYALSHDFVEVNAGDVNTFANERARAQKVLDERASLKKLSKAFSDFEDLVETINEYEHRKDEESLFVWTIDKMQALILGDLDDWRPYEELNISFDQFTKKYTELLSRSSKYCKAEFAELIEYSKKTYYDQPK